MRLARMDQSPRTLRSKSTTTPLDRAHPGCSRPGLTRVKRGPSLTPHDPFDQGCPGEGRKLLRQTRPPALHSKEQQGRYKEVVLLFGGFSSGMGHMMGGSMMGGGVLGMLFSVVFWLLLLVVLVAAVAWF